MAVIVPILSTFDAAGVNKAQRAFKNLGGEAGLLGKTISGSSGLIRTALAGLGAASIVKGLQSSVMAASNLSESISKSNVVFGKNAEVIQSWSATTAKSLGVTQQAALEAAGTYGNLFRAFGINEQESAKMSQSLVTLAADLASFNNVPIEDALLALRSGLSGETEPLKRFGVAINDQRLKLKAAEMGLGTYKGMLPVTIKTQAAFALIMQDTALAQGDVARTSGGLANQLKFLQAGLENAKAGFGEALLPIVLDVVTAFNDKLLPAIEGLVNGLSGKQSLASSFDKSAEAGYQWGQNIRAFIQTVVAYQKPLLVFAGVLAGIWAVSKAVIAATAIVNAIKLIVGAYKLLKTEAILTATAMAFATGGVSAIAGAAGAAAAIAAIGIAFVGVNKLVDTYSAKVEDLPKITYAPDGVLSNSTRTDVSLTGGNKGGGSTATKQTDKAKKAATKQTDKAKKAATDLAKQIAAASKLASDALAKMNDKLTTAREKLNQAKEAFDSFRDGVRDSITGLLNFGEAASAGGFLDNLRNQVTNITGFSEKVNQLLKMGLSQQGIQQVLAAGADAGTRIADELIKGGAGAISETNALIQSVTLAAETLAQSGANQFYKAGITQGQAMVDGIIASIKKAGFIMSGGMAALPKPLQTALNKGNLTSGQATELMGIINNSQSVTAPNKSTGGATINLTVNAGMGANGATIGKDIVEAIKKYERISGPVFLSA